jgi:hypothetical protein
MDDVNDRMGDTVALLRLVLVGDIKSYAEIISTFTPIEIFQVLGTSMGLNAQALRMLGKVFNLSDEEIINRLFITNERLRNGGI